MLPASLWSPDELRELHRLLEANRARALWWLPHDYFPDDLAQWRRVLERIAARGDRATWTRARQLLRALPSSETSDGAF